MKKMFFIILVLLSLGLTACTNKYAAYAGRYVLYDAAGPYSLKDFREYIIELDAQGNAEITAVINEMENGQYLGTHDVYKYRVEGKKIIFWSDEVEEFDHSYENSVIKITNFSPENGNSTLWFRRPE